MRIGGSSFELPMFERTSTNLTIRTRTTTSKASSHAGAISKDQVDGFTEWWNILKTANRCEVSPCLFMHLTSPYSHSYFGIAGPPSSQDAAA
jgi:hypothetical protein